MHKIYLGGICTKTWSPVNTRSQKQECFVILFGDIQPLSFSGYQIRMDRRRFYAMSAQHLGYYALPQVDLGGGSSRNMAGGFNEHLSSIKHFSFPLNSTEIKFFPINFLLRGKIDHMSRIAIRIFKWDGNRLRIFFYVQGLMVITLCNFVTWLSAISMSAISTNGQVKRGPIWISDTCTYIFFLKITLYAGLCFGIKDAAQPRWLF